MFTTRPEIAGTFGAAAAAGRLARLDLEQSAWLLSYAAQQASGISTWMRDRDHVEKAFALGGMTARNAVTAAPSITYSRMLWNCSTKRSNGPRRFGGASRLAPWRARRCRTSASFKPAGPLGSCRCTASGGNACH